MRNKALKPSSQNINLSNYLLNVYSIPQCCWCYSNSNTIQFRVFLTFVRPPVRPSAHPSQHISSAEKWNDWNTKRCSRSQINHSRVKNISKSIDWRCLRERSYLLTLSGTSTKQPASDASPRSIHATRHSRQWHGWLAGCCLRIETANRLCPLNFQITRNT